MGGGAKTNPPNGADGGAMNDPSIYEIVIRGTASERLLARFSDDFAIDVTGDGNTRLIGEIRDSAHLNGVISHLAALTISILSITPGDSTSPDSNHNTERQ